MNNYFGVVGRESQQQQQQQQKTISNEANVIYNFGGKNIFGHVQMVADDHGNDKKLSSLNKVVTIGDDAVSIFDVLHMKSNSK